MFGAAEQDIQLQPTPIWVHLTYQTALIDNTGKLQIRRDVYNLDSRTLAEIKSERGTVESGEERKRVSGTGVAKSARPARTTAQSTMYQAPIYAGPLTLQSIYR